MKKLNKICFVTPYSPKEITGVGKFVDELRKSLKKRNIDSIVITRDAKSDIDASDPMIEINCNKISHFKNIYLGIWTAIEIFKLRKNISIIHIQTPLEQSVFSAVAGRILGIPVIVTIHGIFPEPKRKIKKIVNYISYKLTFLASNQITFVSEESRKYYGFPSAHLILNGINTNFFKQDAILRKTFRSKFDLHNKFVFLFVGRVTFTKGIEEIIKAVSIVKKVSNNIKIIIAGPADHKEMEVFQSEIEYFGIEDCTIILDVQQNVHNLYCASDVVLLPSHFEGLPLVLLESMSCGLLIIASKVGEIPNIVKNYTNGLLIEPRNTEDLADKMIWTINNKDKLAFIAANASNTIQKYYSLDKMTDKYLEIYTNCINKD